MNASVRSRLAGAPVGPGAAVELLHDAPSRLRLRYPPGVDPIELQVRLESLPGVERVRVNVAIRSVAVAHDAKPRTRGAVLEVFAAFGGPVGGRAPGPREAAGGRRANALPSKAAAAGEDGSAPNGVSASTASTARSHALPVLLPAAAMAAVPWLPRRAQEALGVGLAAAKALADLRSGLGAGAVAVEGVSLATSALTGNAFAATASVLLGTVATRWRDRLVGRTEELLRHLAPLEARSYRVRRGRARLSLAADAIESGDIVSVHAGAAVPADGVVRKGSALLAPQAHHDSAGTQRVRAGARICSGRRVLEGEIEINALRGSAESRAQRLRGHVRYVLASAERPSAISPDASRLLALPVMTAGVVMALTRDAGRSAAMLRADPQEGQALAQPLAREAALYLLAREGLLMSSLDAIARYAGAGAIALQDVGVLTEPEWRVLRIEHRSPAFGRAQARRLLLRLASAQGGPRAAEADLRLPDDGVRAWRENGVVVPLRGADALHVAGAPLLRRTWGVELPASAPWAGVTRRLGVVAAGRLLAVVTLGAALRADAGACIAALRGLGLRRVAIFAEDIGGTPCADLAELGADAVITGSRRDQARWLEDCAERGLGPVMVHRGLRELLPPGGLSLCPIEADAGADGVMLSEPFSSLIAGRVAAAAVRERLRQDLGAGLAVNSALIVASALRLAPPIATAAMHHAFVLALLGRSKAIATMSPGPGLAAKGLNPESTSRAVRAGG